MNLNSLAKFLLLLTLAIIITFSAPIYIVNMIHVYEENEQFGNQAHSFLQGRTDVEKTIDTIDIGNKHYWHEPPFPSLVLIPGQLLFGYVFNESLGQLFVLTILIVFLFKLAWLKGFRNQDCLWLVMAFLFGTFMIYLIITPESWYFAQILATTILTVLVFEFETRRRYLVLGLLEGMLVATRPSASLIGLLILGYLSISFYKKTINFGSFLKKLTLFFLPVMFSILGLLWFNYIRFGNPFFNTYLNSDTESFFKASQSLGIFSIQHIPTNIYYFFVASVVPVLNNHQLIFPYITYSPFGLSFFIVCPFFIRALKTISAKNNLIRGYWLVVFATLLLLLTFFAAGYVTFGPRYLADILPILYLFLLLSFRKKKILTLNQKLFILASVLLNIYLLLSPGWLPK